jgi:hypothetical protein
MIFVVSLWFGVGPWVAATAEEEELFYRLPKEDQIASPIGGRVGVRKQDFSVGDTHFKLFGAYFFFFLFLLLLLLAPELVVFVVS